jgi:hypothetical protein
MEGLQVGRIVHYVAYGTPGGEYAAGAHRAAIVADVLPSYDVQPDGSPARPEGTCVLMVINPTGLHFNTSPYSEEPNPGTWHWPERA